MGKVTRGETQAWMHPHTHTHTECWCPCGGPQCVCVSACMFTMCANCTKSHKNCKTRNGVNVLPHRMRFAVFDTNGNTTCCRLHPCAASAPVRRRVSEVPQCLSSCGLNPDAQPRKRRFHWFHGSNSRGTGLNKVCSR